MWQFYVLITDSLINNKGIFDEFVPQASVPLINYMAKTPEGFSQMQYNGQTCLEIMFNLIARLFTVGDDSDEFISMSAVTLTFSLLENVKGVEACLYNIVK